MSVQSHIAEQLGRLFAELRRHDRLYHQLDAPEVSDAQYDALREEFGNLRQAHPKLAAEYAVRDTPGAAVSTAFDEITHRIPMLSLDKVKTAEELAGFVRRTQEFLHNESDPDFFADIKVDGLSVTLRYRGGNLVQAATRGDGRVGEDITHTIRSVERIPVFLEGVPEELEIRGEIAMQKDDFYRLNTEQEAAGKKIFANPRNAAAGSVRQLDARISASRCLRFFAFGLGESSAPVAETMSELYARFDDWRMPHSGQGKRCEDYSAMQNYWQEAIRRRARLAYDIDGVVFKIDALVDQQRMGALTRTPKWAVAAKFDPDSGVSSIIDIVVQVGRSGVVTPVAHLEPVNIGGVLIRRASLHNRDEIVRKDIRIGDMVGLVRAGDVIPKVEEVLMAERPAWSREFVFPEHCPSCARDLLFVEDVVAVRCPGGWDCSAQAVERLKYFVSRGALDIEGIGAKLMERLYREGLVRRPSDFFGLMRHREMVQGWEGFGEKSWNNLMRAIEGSRRLRLSRFLLALGIPQIGEASARTLSLHYGGLEALLNDVERSRDVVLSELIELEGIGAVMAEDFWDALCDSAQLEEIRRLSEELEIVPDSVSGEVSGELSGKTVVFTGKFANFSRAEAQGRARAMGARVTSTVSVKTDLVVAGSEAGSKRNKAEKLGIAIWDETAWLAALNEVDEVDEAG